MSAEEETYKKLLEYRKRTDLSIKPCSRLKKTFVGFDGVERPVQLRYYQVQGILHLLAMRRFLLGDDTGTGKCCKKFTLIKTAGGLRPIEEIYPEETEPDTFYPLSGEGVWVGGKCLPVSGFYDGGEKPTLKIKTGSGYELEGTFVHPVKVRRESGEEWVKLSDLREGDYLCIERDQYEFGGPVSLPNVGSQNGERDYPLPTEMTPELARFLGYLIAEGWFNNDTFTHISQCGEKNPEICRDLENLIPMFGYGVKKRGLGYHICSTQIIRFLKSIGVTQGVAKTKVIPWSILQSDRECVRNFVRALVDALVDAEGSVGKEGIEFSSASEELVRQLQIVLLGFGIVSKRSPKKVKAYPDNTYWRLWIFGENARKYMDEIGLISTRKIEAMSPLQRKKTNSNKDLIPYLESEVGDLRAEIYSRCGRLGYKGGGICRELGVSLYNTLGHIRAGRRLPSYRFLNRILKASERFQVPQEKKASLEIQEVLDQNLFYDPVVSIEEGFGKVYDLTIEDPSHSFVGNGIVNHNTLMAIASLCYIWEKRPEERAIILTDKSAVSQWKKEFEKFTNGVTVVTVDGTAKKREKAYEEFEAATGPAVLVTNYRKPVIDFEHFQNMRDFTFITDEATAYKNPKTQTHQACKYLSDRASRVWALTATLIKNNLLEGFGIYRVLVPKLFSSKKHFIENYTIFYMQPVPGTNRKVPIVKGYKKSHIDSFKLKIDRYFIGRAKWEVAKELPTLTTKHIVVGLSRQQSGLYEEALSGLLQVGEGDTAEDREVTKLTSIIYCQQIVNHPGLIGRSGKSKKLEKLLDLLSEGDLSDEKVIIFTRFKKMVNMVVPLLNEKHKDKDRYCVRVTGDENNEQRQEAMSLFQDPTSETRVILITMAGAAAINLQAAKAIIFYDSPWSAGDYLQILGRMIRIGSIHDSVYAIHLVSEDCGKPTIDGRTQEVLLSKMDLIEKVLGKKLKTEGREEDEDYEVSAEDDITDLFRILRQDATQRRK